jgi:hypothetical protein
LRCSRTLDRGPQLALQLSSGGIDLPASAGNWQPKYSSGPRRQ